VNGNILWVVVEEHTGAHITLDNKLQKNFCICDEYVINLFVYIYEVREGT